MRRPIGLAILNFVFAPWQFVESVLFTKAVHYLLNATPLRGHIILHREFKVYDRYNAKPVKSRKIFRDRIKAL